jgi:hypothetical protein
MVQHPYASFNTTFDQPEFLLDTTFNPKPGDYMN